MVDRTRRTTALRPRAVVNRHVTLRPFGPDPEADEVVRIAAVEVQAVGIRGSADCRHDKVESGPTGRHDMMEPMDRRRVSRMLRAFGAVFGVIAALLMCGPTTGVAQAAVAAPEGDVIALGDPHAPAVVDVYVDPMCPYSGQMVQEQGDEIGRRIEDGTLRVNLRFVNFLDKYSASKTYDIRAIYAAFVVADQSRSSDIAWRFVEQIFSADEQPEEGGETDLDNNQLAELANRVGAPPLAQDLIRVGLPIGFDAHTIAANNLVLLRQFPEPGVPTVVINGGAPVDGNTDWLDQLPG
jgi:protein-disulfide isomerase